MGGEDGRLPSSSFNQDPTLAHKCRRHYFALNSIGGKGNDFMRSVISASSSKFWLFCLLLKGLVSPDAFVGIVVELLS
jgi:hypothetical protein